MVVRTRPAVPEDAPFVIPLLEVSLGGDGAFLLSAPSFPPGSILQALFQQPANRFSYRYVQVVEWEKEIAGVLLSFPASEISRLALSTGRFLYALLGLKRFWHLVRKSIPLLGITEAGKDEFFIQNLAVAPAFRRRGLATLLLQHAEEQALQKGLRACALTVSIENRAAQQLYRKNGYEIVERIPIPHLQRMAGVSGLYRMRKKLKG